MPAAEGETSLHEAEAEAEAEPGGSLLPKPERKPSGKTGEDSPVGFGVEVVAVGVDLGAGRRHAALEHRALEVAPAGGP